MKMFLLRLSIRLRQFILSLFPRYLGSNTLYRRLYYRSIPLQRDLIKCGLAEPRTTEQDERFEQAFLDMWAESYRNNSGRKY